MGPRLFTGKSWEGEILQFEQNVEGRTGRTLLETQIFCGDTHPKTNSSHLKIGHPKRKQSYSNYPFSGGENVSFRGGIYLPTI